MPLSANSLAAANGASAQNTQFQPKTIAYYCKISYSKAIGTIIYEGYTS